MCFRIVELHPALAEAANHIAAAVHEEAVTGNPTTQPTTSGYSYSLEGLSDDEEMDSSQVSSYLYSLVKLQLLLRHRMFSYIN